MTYPQLPSLTELLAELAELEEQADAIRLRRQLLLSLLSHRVPAIEFAEEEV